MSSLQGRIQPMQQTFLLHGPKNTKVVFYMYLFEKLSTLFTWLYTIGSIQY